MRSIALLLVLCLGAALVRAALRPQPTPVVVTPPPTVVVRLLFGLKDEKPGDWSGSVMAVGGKIRALEGWRFLQGDTVSPDGHWTARNRLAPIEPLPLSYPGMPTPPAVQAPQPVGITLTLDVPAPETLQVQTAQGAFEV